MRGRQCLSLDPDVLKNLDKAARRQGVSRSEYVNSVLKPHLQAAHSPLDSLARDLAGAALSLGRRQVLDAQRKHK